MAVEFSLGLTTGSLSSLRPIITWKGVGLFGSERSRYPDTGSLSKSHCNPHSNGDTEQGCLVEIELSVPSDQRIIKTTVVDVELGASESTERIITTMSTSVH